jgi:hypothetical protein
MVRRDRIIGKKQSRNITSRVIGAGAGASLLLAAAAAMATGSAAPAKADFDDLLDPIIQPILTQVTDSISVFDPTLATDLTSWTDTFLGDLNSLDSAVSAASTGASAAASSASPAEVSGTYDLPITTYEDTEPTVQATVDGVNTTDLVDTGSSGLVVPFTDFDGGSTNFLSELESLFSLGFPVSFGESGYSGGVDYLYLTYDEPVDYATTSGTALDTTAPVEVEVYSWDPGDSSSYSANDAFQTFLTDNASTGILGIGNDTSGAAGESPIEYAGFSGVTVNEPGGDLIVSSTPNTTGIELPATGSTVSGLTESVTTGSDGAGTVLGSGTVSDDLDSGGVYGTIPSSIYNGTVPDGDYVNVYDGNTLLYSYQVETDSLSDSESPLVTSGTSIDSGVMPFEEYPITIDYSNDSLYINN